MDEVADEEVTRDDSPAVGQAQQSGPGTSRARIALAAGVGLLAMVVLEVVLSSSPGPEAAAAAPAPGGVPAGVNAAGDAREYARHNRTFHAYDGAWVACRRAEDRRPGARPGRELQVEALGRVNAVISEQGELLRESN